MVAGEQADRGDPVEGFDLSASQARAEVWITRDGRTFPIAEMYRPHLYNAVAFLRQWVRTERNATKRRELKDWQRVLRREIRKRERDYAGKRSRRLAGQADG